MIGRDRDKDRTFLSGSEKRKRKAVKEKNELSQRGSGSLNTFFKLETSNDSEYLDKNFISENSH